MDTRKQGTTLMTGLAAFIATIVIIQIWLVSAALEALLGGELDVLVPAAIASVVLAAVNVALLARALRFDRKAERGRE